MIIYTYKSYFNTNLCIVRQQLQRISQQQTPPIDVLNCQLSSSQFTESFLPYTMPGAQFKQPQNGDLPQPLLPRRRSGSFKGRVNGIPIQHFCRFIHQQDRFIYASQYPPLRGKLRTTGEIFKVRRGRGHPRRWHPGTQKLQKPQEDKRQPHQHCSL